MSAFIRQHLIDPEICIRCYTCEETCPIDAITHNDDNVVVDASICNYCMDCISPCPTGSIDHWRVVKTAWSVEEQYEWDDLPEQEEFAEDSASDLAEAFDDAANALIAEAHSGAGGRTPAPISAAQASVNLFGRSSPGIGTVQGNYRVTEAESESDVRHIIIGLGQTSFPVLEGQTVGVAPPGVKADGKTNDIRLYSISSSRDGEKRNGNNISLTVKRENQGLCSNYLCDLVAGDQVELVGPFGNTFLMPNDPNANILMICTGTGSAPFRGFTERRRRAMPGANGEFVLYFGARTPGELPYAKQLGKLPATLLTQNLVYSREENQAQEYVQDRIQQHESFIQKMLMDENTHVFICGVKGMEKGVDVALTEICEHNSVDWQSQKASMRDAGRFHVETY